MSNFQHLRARFVASRRKAIFRSRWQSVLSRGMICLILFLGVACSSGKPMDPNYVQNMVWQGNDYLWIGNREGVARLNRADGSIRVFDGIDCPRIFLTHNPENVWCTNVAGAERYDGGSWQRFDLDPWSIIQAHDGTLWAGTKQGLARFDIARQEWVHIIEVEPDTCEAPTRLSIGEGIHLAFQASNGAFWFASEHEPFPGVTRWTETSHKTWRWECVSTLPAIPRLEARDGSIWAAGDQGNIERYQGQRKREWQPFGLETDVVGLIEAQNGDIWAIAYKDGAVGRWDGEMWHVWAKRNFVEWLCIGESEECFMAPISGTRYYPADGLGKPESEFSSLVLTEILETQDGGIWVGTNSEGVSRWDGQSWRNYGISDGLNSDDITVLAETPDGVLWAGTWGGGVNYYDSEADRWRPFPDK
jgi:ligand-binding sensor domain-containing protein